MPGRRRALLLLVFTLSACHSRERIFVSTPWPKDQIAVATMTNAFGVPLSAPRTFAPGAPVEFDTVAGAAKIFITTYGPNVRAPNGTPLLDCGVTFDAAASSAELKNPQSVWASTELDPSKQALALAPFTDPLGFALYFRVCGDPNGGCDGYRATIVPVAPNLATRFV